MTQAEGSLHKSNFVSVSVSFEFWVQYFNIIGKTVPSHVVKATALTHIDVQDFPEHRLLSYASVAVVQ